MDFNRIKQINQKLFICLLLSSIFYVAGISEVLKENAYNKVQLLIMIVAFLAMCSGFVLGNYVKGYIPAVIMSISFVLLTGVTTLLYNSGIIMLYLLVILSIITIYQNKPLLYFCSALSMVSAIVTTVFGVATIHWNLKDVMLVPFILFVDILAVALSYHQISDDNRKQRHVIMEKQENAELSYNNLVNLSQVISDSVKQLVGKAKDNRTETQSVLERVSVIMDGLANQNTSLNMQVENSTVIQGQLEEVVTCVDEMNSQVDEVILLARQSENSMVTLNANTEHVSSIAENSKIGVSELLRHVGAVQEVIEIITEVAEQTGLLSLNANIEAAKAGAYGSGFSIVAEEIRKLSDSTSDSVKKVNELLDTLQEKTAVVAKEIQEMNSAFKEQNNEIEINNENMRNLVTAMNSMREGLQRVVYSAKEVTNSNNKVSEEVKNVASISEEISVTIEDVTEACRKVYEASNETVIIAEEVENKAGQMI